MAIELATAYVSIVPSTQDLASSITGSLIPGATAEGTAAGDAAGAGMLGGMKKFLGPAVVAGAVAGVGKGLYEIGSTFDTVADTIRTGTGATGEALDGLVDSAKNVGRNVPSEFGSIAPVVADLNARLGLSGETLETVASQYLQAGNILGQDVDIQGTTAAFSAFGIEGAAVSGAMDALFTASQATGVGMNELAASAQASAPALQALGFSFEDSIALVGQFDKAGLNSQQVMMGMSKGLVTLAKDGEQPEAAFQRVVGEIGGFIEAGDTAAALDLASQVFGTRGAPQFMAAIESGTLSVEDLTASIGASSDTILGVAGETADFGESWQVVKNNALLALEPLGSAVFSGLSDVFAGMVEPMQTVGSWLGENTWAFGALAAVVGGVLVAAFVAWAVAAWATTAALLANPVTWIVVGIVALIAALVLLAANWDTVVATVTGVWGGFVQWVKDSFASIGEWFSTQGAAISTALSTVWNTIKSTAEGIWNGLVSFVKGVPGRFMDGLAPLGQLAATIGGWITAAKDKAVEIFNALVDWVKGVPGRFMDGLNALSELAGKFAGWVLDAKDAAVEKFNDLVEWVKDIPSKITSALGNVGDILKSAGRSIIEGLWNGMKEKWEDVKDWVGGIGDWIADHKGPKAYDLALLKPAGGWIMQGLQAGMREEIPNMARTLRDVTSTIQVGAIAGGGATVAAAGAGSITTADIRQALDGATLTLTGVDYLANSTAARINTAIARGV